MSKSNAAENDFQAYLFDGTRPSWDGAAQLFITLHTADPGEAGDQSTSEATYTGYARLAVNRPGGFTVTGNVASLAAQLVFGERTDAGATQTITHVGIGVAASGATKLLHSYALNSPINVDQNDSPYIPAAAFTVTED